MLLLPNNVVQEKEVKYYNIYEKLQLDNEHLLKKSNQLNNEINQFRMTANTLKNLIQQKEEEITQLEQNLGVNLKDIYSYNKLMKKSFRQCDFDKLEEGNKIDSFDLRRDSLEFRHDINRTCLSLDSKKNKPKFLKGLKKRLSWNL